MEDGAAARSPYTFYSYSYDLICMDVNNDQYKRKNKKTGEVFKPGDIDDTGRVFLKYTNKHGNDGYYLEVWVKDLQSYLKKIESN